MYEFIGRPSTLQNKYVVGKHGDRDWCCDKYDEWLDRKVKQKDPEVMAALKKICKQIEQGHDVALVCFCVPLRCHGRSVIKHVKRMLRRRAKRKLK